MSDIKTVFTDKGIRIIKVVTSNGPGIKRPRFTIETESAFTPSFIKSGNVVYTCKLFTMLAPAEHSPVQIDLAQHLNGGVFKITYQGVNYVAPSLKSLGCMGSGAVFDLKDGEITSQRKVVEIGNRDAYVEDQISDISVDDVSIMTKTNMISERAPNVYVDDVFPVLNTEYVSDVVISKKIEIVDNGIIDYYVMINIPARHTHGNIEVLSGTMMNNIANIRLVSTNKAWNVMKDGEYSVNETSGFILAKNEQNSMGIALIDWPRGAMMMSPNLKIRTYEHVSKWNVTQKFGSKSNTSIGIPGGEYSWKLRFFFGPVSFSKKKINNIRTIPHGNDYKYLYEENKMKEQIRRKELRNIHEYGYK